MAEARDESGEVRARLARPGLEVAPTLLGWTLSHTTEHGTVTVRLTEVEAYMGEDDPASHAHRGPTARNAVMFGPAGHLYTYLSYGVHWCSNVVTGEDGRASAVLLRAGRVVEGASLARHRRGGRVKDAALARGPGCLGQALGLHRGHNGMDLLGAGPLRLRPTPDLPPSHVASGHRVGVRLAHDVPWRFWVDGDPTVSAYRRSPRVRP
ncbi:DNA-3-methyladenine glycosylase [Ornithinimicrobium sediminis]|uniref:DNA-3-methyladenine glycosylase n=1 Tax=Ornithinimicrobium sediminis TaxID=2904603 RepID=UPI001E2DA97B|nr:DNA-3-methyladenine glycosylase [Ornithinimicrobium sediminis]